MVASLVIRHSEQEDLSGVETNSDVTTSQGRNTTSHRSSDLDRPKSYPERLPSSVSHLFIIGAESVFEEVKIVNDIFPLPVIDLYPVLRAKN